MNSSSEYESGLKAVHHLWITGLIILIFLSVFIFQQPILIAVLFLFSLLIWYCLYIEFKFRSIHLVGLLLFSSVVLPPIDALPSLPEIRPEEIVFFVVFPILLFFINKKTTNRYLTYFLYAVITFGIAIFLSIQYGRFIMGIPVSMNDYFELLKIFKLFVVVYLISNLKFSHKKLYVILYILLFSFLFSAIIGLMQFYGILGMEKITAPYFLQERIYDVHNRMMGTFFNPNTYGTAMTIGAVVAVALIFHEKKMRSKLILLTTAVTIAFCIALTQSRTAIVVLFFSIFLVTVSTFVKNRLSIRQLLLIITSVIIISLALASMLTDQVLTRFLALGNIMEDMSWQMRLLAWYFNLNLFLESIWLGWGPAKLAHTTIVDSEYILILRRYGLIGFSAYMLTYLIPLVKSFKMLNYSGIKFLIGQIVFVTTIVFLIANITNPLFHEIQFMDLWAILLGVFFAVPVNDEPGYQEEIKRKAFD